MNKRTITLMAAGLGLCLTLTAWLAWSNWQLQQQLNNMGKVQHDASSQSEPGWLRRLEPQDSPLTSPLAPTTGWDPFAEMDRMQQQIDRWMQGSPFGFSHAPGGSLFSAGVAQPDILIEEDKEAYRVRITVPEGSELELHTAVEDSRLTVSGAISANVDESDNGSSRRFVSSSQFSRQFMLNSPVDSLGMSKEARDNEVIITLPKA